MKYFNKKMSIEDAKKTYRKLSKEFHPDLGGDAEMFKELNNEYEMFLNNYIADVFDSCENTHGNDVHVFQDILNKIIHFNIEIEIVGYWIYARESFAYKDQLKELGFWFSGKHKAWVYNGSEKIKRATRLSLDQIKSHYGFERIRDKEEQEKITA